MKSRKRPNIPFGRSVYRKSCPAGGVPAYRQAGRGTILITNHCREAPHCACPVLTGRGELYCEGPYLNFFMISSLIFKKHVIPFSFWTPRVSTQGRDRSHSSRPPGVKGFHCTQTDLSRCCLHTRSHAKEDKSHQD